MTASSAAAGPIPTMITTTTLVHRPIADTTWWSSATVYQAAIHSFADGDDDGHGDLLGMTNRLAHLARLGVDAIALDPHERDQMGSARDIDPGVGTAHDLDALLDRAHCLGLRVLLDLPCHDLPADDIASTLHTWWERGLDGVRLIAHDRADVPETDVELPLSPNRCHTWRTGADSAQPPRVLALEADRLALAAQADLAGPSALHHVCGSQLIPRWSARATRDQIEATLSAFDRSDSPTVWRLTDSTGVRPTTRLARLPGQAPDIEAGLRRARAAGLLHLALPGAAYVMQGEELGLPSLADAEAAHDGPLPWQSDAPAFGFSTSGKCWLPLPAEWAAYALDHQMGVRGSAYEMYRSALRIRRDFGLGTGSLAWLDGVPEAANDTVIAFVNRIVLVLANLGCTPLRVPGDLNILHASDDLPIADDGAVHIPADTTVWARLDRP